MSNDSGNDALEDVAPQPRYIEHITFEGRDCVVLSPEEYGALWEIALRATPPTTNAREEYARKNPLGGPAKMFEAIASRIRAGEDYYAVLADYDLCVVNDSAANDQASSAIALLAMLAETPPIMKWKEYEDRGEQRIPCFIQVETAQAIAEFFPVDNSGKSGAASTTARR